MEPREYESLKDVANDIKVLRKLLYMHMRIEGHLLPGGKEDLMSFTSSGYRMIR